MTDVHRSSLGGMWWPDLVYRLLHVVWSRVRIQKKHRIF